MLLRGTLETCQMATRYGNKVAGVDGGDDFFISMGNGVVVCEEDGG